MIITRTPLRISFAGGGSDLPAYYRAHGQGAVVSVAINKYIYLSLHPYFDHSGYLLKYSQHENVRHLKQIQHRIIRQVFSDFKISGVDFNSSADIPGGTGLGSSSAFTVGLALLSNTYKEGPYMNREALAAYASKVEIEKLGEPIGKQDHYACAVGDMNFIQFNPDESVVVEKLHLTQASRKRLENNLLLFYTGINRSASAILSEQAKNTAQQSDKSRNVTKMVELARELRLALLNNQIDAMGEILHENWKIKRRLAKGITNPKIDEWYEKARNNGAEGGKILGAGGGGFLLFYVLKKNQAKVRQALRNLREVPIKFDQLGTTILYQQ